MRNRLMHTITALRESNLRVKILVGCGTIFLSLFLYMVFSLLTAFATSSSNPSTADAGLQPAIKAQTSGEDQPANLPASYLPAAINVGTPTGEPSATPTATILPTLTPSPTATPTAVGKVGTRIQAPLWTFTLTGGKLTSWLAAPSGNLEGDGQWFILHGEVESRTAESVAVYGYSFQLFVSGKDEPIPVHTDGTLAVAQTLGIDQTVVDPTGLDLSPGQRKTMILVFFIPRKTRKATLHIVDANADIQLGKPGSFDAFPTPTPTSTPTRTPTPRPTATPYEPPEPVNTPTFTERVEAELDKDDPGTGKGPVSAYVRMIKDLRSSKLGIHVQWNNSPAILEFVREAKPAVVKAVDDLGFLGAVKEASPGTVTIGRISYTSQKMEGDPRAVARAYVLENLETYYNNPWVDYWEGYNEPDVTGRMDWYAAFEAERVRVMALFGLRTAIGGFAAGTPEWDEFAAFVPAIAAAFEHGGILSLHEYSAPTLDYGVGTGLPGHPSYPDRGILTLRYRWWYEDFLKPLRLVIPLVITEAGIDGGVANRPGPPGLGWQDFTDYWVTHEGLSNNGTDAYIKQLAWYDAELRKDFYVIGFTIFTAGPIGEDWQSFDITPILPDLAAYVRSR